MKKSSIVCNKSSQSHQLPSLLMASSISIKVRLPPPPSLFLLLTIPSPETLIQTLTPTSQEIDAIYSVIISNPLKDLKIDQLHQSTYTHPHLPYSPCHRPGTQTMLTYLLFPPSSFLPPFSFPPLFFPSSLFLSSPPPPSSPSQPIQLTPTPQHSTPCKQP